MDTRLIAVGCLLLTSVAWAADLEVVNQWNVLQFDTPFNYPSRSQYRPEKTPFTSFEVGWDRIFLSVPRIFSGSPATLGWIPRNKPGIQKQLSPPLQAYPSWEWHVAAAAGEAGSADNCTGMVSVFRMRIDRCNRLWVLDSGVVDSLETFTVACPPKILIFDLNNDRLVRSITLPQEVLRRNSLLTNLVLDERGGGGLGQPVSCDNTFVYIADSVSPGLVVYDSSKDTTWRMTHPLMFPDPDYGTYRVAGEYFTLMDGVLGIAVTPPGVNPPRLYFQPFASDRIFSVPTSALQRGPNPGDDSDLPVSLVGHKSSQSAGIAFDPRDSALYFSPISETAIASWIPGSPDHRVVAFNPNLLQFVLDFRSAERDGNTIWLISTRLQKYMRDTINPKETNLRIIRIVQPYTPTPFIGNNTLFLYKNSQGKS